VSLCTAVDGIGNVLIYNGSAWSSPYKIDQSAPFYSVSCPKSNFCVATDWSGNVLTYDGSSWSKPVSIDAPSELTSLDVSCSSARFCAAVDNKGNVLTYRGTSWSSPDEIDTTGLAYVSCPTASFCAAVDWSGNALTYRGSSWSKPVRIGLNQGGLESVSCPTASFCAALDYDGNALTYRGSAWSKPARIAVGRVLTSLSCPTASFCAAVDTSDAFTYSPPPTSKTALKLSNARVTYGDEGVEHLSVTVSPEFTRSTPYGSVTIKESTTTLCVITLSSAKGSCTLSAKKLPVGTYHLVATYGGSTDFDGSTSVKESLMVAKATSKTALKLSNARVTYGDEGVEQLSVTVSPEFTGSTPYGSVTIKESTTTLCVITLSSTKGSCKLSARKLNAATYSLVATYGGSTDFDASASAKQTLTVVK
jgi:hypothetical protein